MQVGAKRWLIWAGIGAVVVFGIGVTLMPQPVRVDTVRLAPMPLLVSVDEEGETRVHDVFLLSAPVAGRVRRIDVHIGDPVVAGETVLAQIEPGDPSLLDPRSEAQARAAVQAAESSRLLATAGVDQAQAEFEFAQGELQRARELSAEGTISRRESDDAERAYKIARAALATAHAAFQVADFELQRARAQLLTPTEAQARRGNCECVPITAPVSGRVLQIPNTSERIVAAGETLLEIGDPSNLEVVVDVHSADAVRIEEGQRVLFERWGGEVALEGRVRRVEPFGFTKVSALGIEEQRVNVVIDFVSEHALWARLGHGYQVDARIVLWEGGSTLAVPLTALFRHGDDWAVFVNDGGRARLTRVQLGRSNGIVAEVVDGLVSGTDVVVHPSDRVVDGVRIEARS
ncbi:MAG: HlyD family efflux transporter periplasmic adaptor subunit [Pseudomonadales bacterium]